MRKIAKSLAGVHTHTHTHTQYNLIDRKEVSSDE